MLTFQNHAGDKTVVLHVDLARKIFLGRNTVQTANQSIYGINLTGCVSNLILHMFRSQFQQQDVHEGCKWMK